MDPNTEELARFGHSVQHVPEEDKVSIPSTAVVDRSPHGDKKSSKVAVGVDFLFSAHNQSKFVASSCLPLFIPAHAVGAPKVQVSEKRGGVFKFFQLPELGKEV